VAALGPVDDAVRAVVDVLAAGGRMEVSELTRMACVRVADLAAEHLFLVACGLESMAAGEDRLLVKSRRRFVRPPQREPPDRPSSA
jgi:glutamyl-tRNA reductase